MEKTFIILKPEAVSRGLIGELLSRFEKKGLKIDRLKIAQISEAVARDHYHHHAHQPYFQGILDALTGGPVVLAVLSGPQAVSVVRRLVGETNPVQAAPGTIRGDYGTVLPYNVIHASDSVESAQAEAIHFFGTPIDQELERI